MGFEPSPELLSTSALELDNRLPHAGFWASCSWVSWFWVSWF